MVSFALYISPVKVCTESECCNCIDFFISLEGRHVAAGHLPGLKVKFYCFKLLKAAHAALAVAAKLLELVCVAVRDQWLVAPFCISLFLSQ